MEAMYKRKNIIKNILFKLFISINILFFNINILMAQSDLQIELDGARNTRSIILPLNKSAVVESPVRIGEMIIANPEIASALLNSPKRLFLIGKKVGQTNAIFLDTNGVQILTLEIAVEPDLRELEIALNSIFPASRIALSSINNNIILKGKVESSADAASAADITARFIGDKNKVLNLLGTTNSEQVMLRVRIVEMKRSFLKQLGVNSSAVATINNTLLNIASVSSVSKATNNGLNLISNTGSIGSFQNLKFTFKALEERGYIKTLAEPNLTALTGENAEVLVGGEYPVPVGQSNGSVSVAFKKFGVSLNFTPVVLSGNLIHLAVATEVSQLSNQNSVKISSPGSSDGLIVPGTDIRRVKTSAELSSGQSLVIAGLLQENIKSLINGIPGLMAVPILGQLFRSQEFISEQTELVVIVTPYLAVPTTDNNLRDPAQGHQVANQMQAILFGQIEANYGIDRKPGETQIQSPVGYIVD